MSGILERSIEELPIAVLDFETTGLTPGQDRVVEVCVMRQNPGEEPRLVLDTLVNPMRRMAATEIHGITDDDVKDAPRFQDVAGELVTTLSGAVVVAYNVYFDMRFLTYELGQLGVEDIPPHMCLMYLRPMLGLGKRCSLTAACEAYSIAYEQAHIAAHDVNASAELLREYLEVIGSEGIRTYNELASLKAYKFTHSWANPLLLDASGYSLHRKCNFCSRVPQPLSPHLGAAKETKQDNALRTYWDILQAACSDFEISEEELWHAVEERKRLGLTPEQICFLHARIFQSAISEFIEDEHMDEEEAEKLRSLHRGLTRLGWAPGN